MRRSSTKTRNCQTTRTIERGEECLRAANALLVKSSLRLRIGRRRAARRLFAHLAHRPMLGVPHMQHYCLTLMPCCLSGQCVQLSFSLRPCSYSQSVEMCAPPCALRLPCGVRPGRGRRARACASPRCLPRRRTSYYSTITKAILSRPRRPSPSACRLPPAAARAPPDADRPAVAAGGARRRDELKTILFVTQPPRTHVSYTQRTPDTYKIYAPTTPRTRRRSHKHGTPTAAYAFSHVTRVPHVVVER